MHCFDFNLSKAAVGPVLISHNVMRKRRGFFLFQKNVRLSGLPLKRIISLALAAVFFLLAGLVTPVLSEEKNGEATVFNDIEESTRQSCNPLGGDFMLLQTEIAKSSFKGDITRTTRESTVFKFQPIIPVGVEDIFGKDWVLVNRPTFQYFFSSDVVDKNEMGRQMAAGTLDPGDLPFKSVSGFGDFIHFSLLGKSVSTQNWGGGDIVWGAGPTFMFPTASTEELGTGKYSIGPAAVAGFIGKKGVLAGLFQHWSSYASGGRGSGDDVNYSWLQLYYLKTLKNGWQVGGTPIITANWEQESDNRYTIPVGLGIFKNVFIGPMPVKIGLEAQYSLVRPDNYGEEYRVSLKMIPIMPNILNLFK